DRDHLEVVDVNVEWMLLVSLVADYPFLVGVQLHYLVDPGRVELAAVDEELAGRLVLAEGQVPDVPDVGPAEVWQRAHRTGQRGVGDRRAGDLHLGQRALGIGVTGRPRAVAQGPQPVRPRARPAHQHVVTLARRQD